MDGEDAPPTIGPWGSTPNPFRQYNEEQRARTCYEQNQAASWIIKKIEKGELKDWPTIARELTLKGIVKGTPPWDRVHDAWVRKEA